MNVRLHIDRLILEGFDVPHGGHAVRAAVEQELTRLIAAGGLPQLATAATPVVRAPQFEVTTPSKPAPLGRAIGRAVWGGLGGGK
jgi:hypothetical protein